MHHAHRVHSTLRTSGFLLCAVLSLSACAPSRTVEMFYGEDGFGLEMQRDETSLSMEEAQSLIGQRYYIGGPAGSMGSIKIKGIDVAGACNNIVYAMVLEASAPQSPFVASRKPLNFVPITLSPAARAALVPEIQALLRAEGLTNGVVADEAWQFAPEKDAPYFIAIAHSPRDPDRGALGEPGDFDTLFLFRERAGKPILLDHHMAMVRDGYKTRVYPYPLAVAVDPKDQRVALFVHWLFYEGDQVTEYDLSRDRLEERTVGGCYY